MEYFGFENTVGSILDVTIFLFYSFMYLRLKTNNKQNRNSSYNYFRTAMGLFALSYLLPFILTFAWGAFLEKYFAFSYPVILLSAYVPILIALVLLVKVANLKLNNA